MAAERISRDDPRFKCRMCGKPIFGVGQADKDYYAKFYCSADCRSAHLFYFFACLNVILFLPSGWIVAFLISGTAPISMLFGITAILVILVIVNVIGVYKAIEIWDKRRQISENKLLDSIEADLEN